MPVDPTVLYASLDDLSLDPKNPRLGRENVRRGLRQPEVLEIMLDWNLEELAVSFMESGFWPQEALLVVKEELNAKQRLVVVEGNRHLAALKYLKMAVDGKAQSARWKELVKEKTPAATLFKRIPYLLASTRDDIVSFLGFRHVTGIMEWKPAEKAEYIAKMIELHKMSYEDVMRRIGSKTPAVRQNYIAYRLLLQMEDEESISVENVEEKFSVLYLSLRTEGVRRFLDINIKADPKTALKPVPKGKLRQLASFALWLFGDDKRPPLFSDSRLVDSFGQILESSKAVEYLERAEKPIFDYAHQLAGGDEPEFVNLVDSAADNVELALARAHLYKDSKKLAAAAERLIRDAAQLGSIFATDAGAPRKAPGKR